MVIEQNEITFEKHSFEYGFCLEPKNKGQVARTLATYLSRALKVDFFKGEFIADKLKEQLEKKFPDKNK